MAGSLIGVRVLTASEVKARHTASDSTHCSKIRRVLFGRVAEVSRRDAHFAPYSYYVFGLYPPQLAFNITIDVKHLAYKTNDGEEVWETLSKFDIGPHKTTAKSDNVQVCYWKQHFCGR